MSILTDSYFELKCEVFNNVVFRPSRPITYKINDKYLEIEANTVLSENPVVSTLKHYDYPKECDNFDEQMMNLIDNRRPDATRNI